jgi:carbon storage regulator
MLVLSRKVGERIRVGDNVVLTVVAIHGERIRLGIEAPSVIPIRRGELEVLPDSSQRPPGPARQKG